MRFDPGRSRTPCALTAMALAASLWGAASPGPARAQAGAERTLVVRAGSRAPAVTEQRLALVIGNSAYKDAPLTNPANDARAITKALQQAGFSVISRQNLDQRGMLQALREFGDRLRNGGVGIFYYAGHGMQIKGRNYLIPVGSQIEREDEVAYAAVDAQAVLDKMEAAGNGTNIMILDACRNNPFARSFRSGQAGLAQMDAPVGTLVAFATSPGSVASDGGGQNGLYTQHLLEAMRQPGAKVEDVFKRVRAGVRRDSQGKQVPWESTSLEGDFYFQPPRPEPVAAVPPEPVTPAVSPELALDRALWAVVKDSQVALELRAYLGRFPGGEHAPQARERLAALQATQTRPEAAPTVPPSMPPAPAPALQVAAAAPRPAIDLHAPLELPPGADPEIAEQVERRTEELLQELSAQTPAPVQVAVPARKKEPPVRSARGYALGDRWRYQVVDKFKGEVVNNWSFKVTAILPEGDIILNDGQILADPDLNVRRSTGANLQSDVYDSHWHMVPSKFEPGWTETFRYKRHYVRRDGYAAKQDWEGKMVVRGLETVRTPAGEFQAWRVERDASANSLPVGGGASWFAQMRQVSWYSTELRAAVAREWEFRAAGRLTENLRLELTSFEVAGHQLARQ